MIKMNPKFNVRLEGVSTTVGAFTLKNIDFVIRPGTIVGIIGENGAGKTTLLKIIAQTLSIDSGKLSVPSKKEIGLVFDSNHFPEELSAKELNIVMSHIFPKWKSNTFMGYLDSLKIPNDLIIQKYSKGMKTKLGIATALSHDPRLLLLDEITSGLDPLIRDEVLSVIKKYVMNHRALAIMTTHLLDDVIKIADKVIVLDHGSVILNENVSEIIDSHSLEDKLKQLIVGR